MLYDGEELKSQRGKTLLLTLKKSANADELLKAALDKHRAHSKDVVKESTKYVILYPDGTKVEKLKEVDEEFVIIQSRMW